MKFTYTRHALEKMDALGIMRREVENVIKKCMKWRETDKKTGKSQWHARMGGIEVVFVEIEGLIVVKVITVHYA